MRLQHLHSIDPADACQPPLPNLTRADCPFISSTLSTARARCTMTQTESNARVNDIRAQVKHPIIDSDAHAVQIDAVFREQFLDAVAVVAGSKLRRELESAPDLTLYLLERTTPMGHAFGSKRW